ncbi:hypothetical protein KX924_13745 [Streptomyces sp. II-2-2-2]
MNERVKPSGRFGDPDWYQFAKGEIFLLTEALLEYPRERECERHFLLAAVRRTLSLEKAFVHAIEDHNGQMGMTLVRLNLDTLARAYALYWAEETEGMTAESFARDFAAGRIIRAMKLRGAKEKATDAWLIAQISPLADWIQTVYENTSGAIHFSDFHVRQLFQQRESMEKLEDGSLMVRLVLGGADHSPPDGLYTEVRQAFLEITLMLIGLIRHRCERAGVLKPD